MTPENEHDPRDVAKRLWRALEDDDVPAMLREHVVLRGLFEEGAGWDDQFAREVGHLFDRAEERRDALLHEQVRRFAGAGIAGATETRRGIRWR